MTSTGIEQALDIFHKTKGRPTFIILDSHIGYGSPHKQDTAAAHGEPLGEEEIRLTKRDYGWPEDAQVPGSRRRARALRRRNWRARRAGPRTLDRAVHGLPVEISGARDRDRPDAAA